MNDFLELIDEQHIETGLKVSSKKALFEHISKLVCSIHPSLADEDLVCALMQREKLGSTSIGNGIAIPHCRLIHCTKSILGLFTLQEPIIYNDDNHEVDLIALLLVPESANDEHVDLLSEFAKRLSQTHVQSELRQAQSSTQALAALLRQPYSQSGQKRFS